VSHGLIIRLIIQTIRRDPSRSDQIDDPSNLSRPDPSGADQIDAEHQATDLAVWGFESLAARTTPQVTSLELMAAVRDDHSCSVSAAKAAASR
jgi:hypothetical protein